MDKKLLGLIGVFLLVFGVFMSMLFFNSPRGGTRIRAAGSTASCENTYLFAQFLVTQVGSSVQLNVFVRDADSEAVGKVVVTCSASLGTLTPSQQTSQNNGSTTFSLTSTTQGVSNVTCSIACGQISNSVSVQFTL